MYTNTEGQINRHQQDKGNHFPSNRTIETTTVATTATITRSHIEARAVEDVPTT